MKVTIGLPIWGDSPDEVGIDRMVADCRETGMDGVMVGDHVAFSSTDSSKYPYKESGEFFLQPDDDWYEAFVALGYIAAHAGPMEIGLGVCLPVLRPPALVAKQVATLARLCPGGMTLGVGAGWMRGEFEALGVPWKARGRRLEDAVAVIREYWKGRPTPGTYGAYEIPDGTTSYPVPPSPVPILIGGSSSLALDRAARIGDGWFGACERWDGGDQVVAPHIAEFRANWQRHRPGAGDPQIAVVQPVQSSATREDDFGEQMADRLVSLRRMGVGTVLLNLSWRRPERVPRILEAIRSAADQALLVDVHASSPTGG